VPGMLDLNGLKELIARAGHGRWRMVGKAPAQYGLPMFAACWSGC